ncbi:MAG: glycosyltransferase family A protein [Ginsengibacter sp.]
MTCYNREKYIAEAIESVLASTFTNFELIIVDDGSSDRTISIAKSFESRDSRVSVYKNEINLGDYPNRNKAASYARGKYLKYVDSDDYIYPWALGYMSEIMERFPKAGLGFCSMEPNDKRPFPFELTPKEAYEYHFLGPGLFRRSPLSAIINKKVFNTVAGFKPIRMAGDFEMWQRLALYYNTVLMPQGMVWYRKHDAQEVNDFSDFSNIYEKIKIEYLDSNDCPLDKKLIISIKRKEKMKIMRSILVNTCKWEVKKLKMGIRNLRINR